MIPYCQTFRFTNVWHQTLSNLVVRWTSLDLSFYKISSIRTTYLTKPFRYYIQTIQVSVMPTEKYPIILDEWYEAKDHFGRTLQCFARGTGKIIHSTTENAPAGKMSTFFELINGQLYFTMVLEEKNVQAVRIFDRVSWYTPHHVKLAWYSEPKYTELIWRCHQTTCNHWKNWQ